MTKLEGFVLSLPHSTAEGSHYDSSFRVLRLSYAYGCHLNVGLERIYSLNYLASLLQS